MYFTLSSCSHPLVIPSLENGGMYIVYVSLIAFSYVRLFFGLWGHSDFRVRFLHWSNGTGSCSTKYRLRGREKVLQLS